MGVSLYLPRTLFRNYRLVLGLLRIFSVQILLERKDWRVAKVCSQDGRSLKFLSRVQWDLSDMEFHSYEKSVWN